MQQPIHPRSPTAGLLAVFVAATAAGCAGADGNDTNPVSTSERAAPGNAVANDSTSRPNESYANGFAEVEGSVTAIGPAQFELNGLPVNHSTATYSDGTIDDLFVGDSVEVYGTFMGNEFVAQVIEFERTDDDDNESDEDEDQDLDSDDDDDRAGLEIEGLIADYLSPQSFTVGNISIEAPVGISVEYGSIADLANGRCVEVYGAPRNGPNGLVILASQIEIESDCE